MSESHDGHIIDWLLFYTDFPKMLSFLSMQPIQLNQSIIRLEKNCPTKQPYIFYCSPRVFGENMQLCVHMQEKDKAVHPEL